MKIEEYRYQIVFLGEKSEYEEVVNEQLKKSLLDEQEKYLCSLHSAEVDSRFPAVGVYFGKKGHWKTDAEAVCELLSKGVPVLPVVEDLNALKESIPKELTPYNAVAVKTGSDCRHIVDYLLEEFRLVCGKKKVFISYCRKDASVFAQCLHDELVHRKYDVFLDSYSIDAGLDFQAGLQEFLADSDVMVFLHSPQSIHSRWVREELAKANRLQVGIVEVLWPGCDKNIQTEPSLTYPVSLDKRELYCPLFRSHFCNKVADAVDHWRIRSVQSRMVNLRAPLLKELKQQHDRVFIQPSFVVISKKKRRKELYQLVMGLPGSMHSHETRNLCEKYPISKKKTINKAWVVYDRLYLQKKSVEHLNWLNGHLPVKFKDIRESIMKEKLKGARSPLKKIFLSASIPSSTSKYYQSIDIIAICDAVRALASCILPCAHLVWGGHPTITPLIKEVLGSMGVAKSEIKKHVTLYQSRYFTKDFPIDNNCVEDIQLTDVQYVDGQPNEEASIKEMRARMLDKEHQYVAGFFIGGMEGVKEEYRLFRENHPNALLLPIVTTGGAALDLFKDQEADKVTQSLKEDYDYQTLFEKLWRKMRNMQGGFVREREF